MQRSVYESALGLSEPCYLAKLIYTQKIRDIRTICSNPILNAGAWSI